MILAQRYKAILLSSFFLLLSACLHESDEPTDAAPAVSHPVAVTTLNIITEDIPVYYDYVGQVDASLEIDIRSRISGIIEKRHFTEGSEVRSGQLLFELDDAPYQAENKQAQAAIVSAQAQRETAAAQLSQAERELKRVTPLTEKKMLSQNQRDDAISALEIARAQMAVAEAAIKQAQANILTTQINLEYSKIRAPIRGIIGRVLQNRGALVQAGSNSLLTTLVQIDPVHINFGIPEKEWVDIRSALKSATLILVGETLSVELLSDANYKGQLGFQDYKVDNQTGNVAMRATMANGDNELLPGQFVRVRLSGMIRPNSIAIPQRAVLDGPSGKYVYLAVQGEGGSFTAQQRSVTLGEWVDIDAERQNYWIVNSGLTSSDGKRSDPTARSPVK